MLIHVHTHKHIYTYKDDDDEEEMRIDPNDNQPYPKISFVEVGWDLYGSSEVHRKKGRRIYVAP